MMLKIKFEAWVIDTFGILAPIVTLFSAHNNGMYFLLGILKIMKLFLVLYQFIWYQSTYFVEI